MSSTQLREQMDSAELAENRSAPPKLWQQRVAYALRYIDDRIMLNRSSLSRLAHIRRLADERYNGRLLPRGLALQQVLIESAQKVIAELDSEPALAKTRVYLDLLMKGYQAKEISRQLGLSREHVARTYRRNAIDLVTEEFLSTVRNGG